MSPNSGTSVRSANRTVAPGIVITSGSGDVVAVGEVVMLGEALADGLASSMPLEVQAAATIASTDSSRIERRIIASSFP